MADVTAEAPQSLDLSKPVIVPYSHAEYPKVLYKKDGRVVSVKSAEAEDAAKAEGYQDRPFAGFDYSIVRNGKAPKLPKDE